MVSNPIKTVSGSLARAMPFAPPTDKCLSGRMANSDDAIHAGITAHGFVAFQAADLGIPDGLGQAARQLVDYGRPGALPPDPYDPTGCRHRVFCQLLYNPHTDQLIVPEPYLQDGRKVEPYFQSSTYNCQNGGVLRYLDALPAALRDNDFMHWLVRRLYAATPGEALRDCVWLCVGIHLLQLLPEPGGMAAATPNCLHQDGEAVTWMLMLHREGIEGGVSYVTTSPWVGKQPEEVSPDDMLATTTLLAPLDGLGVIDERVAHHVSPVLRRTERSGCRTVLIIDFSELIPFRAMATT
ncbi:MAG: 2OG-Fe dioxygenase family protein [Azospirillaceae bacterium]|nr:2OG-Fe dioxygenase family protein [Azospirillaceae bacterium]